VNGRVAHQGTGLHGRCHRRGLADGGLQRSEVAILHQAEVEKGVVNSAGILWTNAASGKQKTAAFVPPIDQRAAALLSEVKTAFNFRPRSAAWRLQNQP
jgi:hypothetical protein